MLNTEQCWASVTARDAAADGTFVYAVRTSGVYCRPACPSRLPLRKNVAFYETTEAAEVAEVVEATETVEIPEEGEDTQLFVVEERLIRGRPARVLSDGTVEAETDDGWMRFENLEHLEEYLDAMSPGQA